MRAVSFVRRCPVMLGKEVLAVPYFALRTSPEAAKAVLCALTFSLLPHATFGVMLPD
jgi:hypothetical protein